MIVDSHCHLDFDEIYNNLDEVISRANQKNVKCLLTICTTLDSYKKIKLIVSKYTNVYGTFGIHPHETIKNENVNSNLIVSAISNNKKIIGVGETGLDFYYNHSDKSIQIKSFIEHIKAAQELNIPLIVHSRNAEKETYDILESEMKNAKIKVLMHCFTGSKEFAKKLLNLQCYFSVSGIITFKNSIELCDTISIIPIDRLLVETDSPYLAPVPFRGKSNEPSYIVETVYKLASIKKLTKENTITKTTSNFTKIFNI